MDSRPSLPDLWSSDAHPTALSEVAPATAAPAREVAFTNARREILPAVSRLMVVTTPFVFSSLGA
jgi:hypothetical protein